MKGIVFKFLRGVFKFTRVSVDEAWVCVKIYQMAQEIVLI